MFLSAGAHSSVQRCRERSCLLSASMARAPAPHLAGHAGPLWHWSSRPEFGAAAAAVPLSARGGFLALVPSPPCSTMAPFLTVFSSLGLASLCGLQVQTSVLFLGMHSSKERWANSRLWCLCAAAQGPSVESLSSLLSGCPGLLAAVRAAGLTKAWGGGTASGSRACSPADSSSWVTWLLKVMYSTPYLPYSRILAHKSPLGV